MNWTKLAVTTMTLAILGTCFTACDTPPSPEYTESVTERSLEGDGTEFELDKNAIQETTTDWNNLINAQGQPTPIAGSFDPVRFRPDVGDDDNVFTGGGSKDPNEINQWRWKQDTATPDKDNITNAYATPHVSASGDRLIYFGADRFANDGSAQLGFWFFRNKVTLNENTGRFDGVHEKGDLLILANFTQGGAVTNIAAFEWVGSGGDAGGGSLQTKFSGIADCTSQTDTPVCAVANDIATDAPWPYTAKQPVPGGDFPPASFFEGGANLDALFPGTAPCFASFMAETRSSTSPSATLKDFVLESFEVCEPEMELTTTCNGASLDTSSGLRIAVDWSVQLCNESTGVDLENVVVSLPDGSTATVLTLPDEGTEAQRCRTFSSIDADRDPYFPDSADNGETDPCDAEFTIEASATADADIGGPTPEEVTADDTDVCKLCPCTP